MLPHLFLRLSSVLLYLDCLPGGNPHLCMADGMYCGALLCALAPTASVTDSGSVQTPRMDLDELHGLYPNTNHQDELWDWICRLGKDRCMD